MSFFQAQRYLRKKYVAYLELMVEKDKEKRKIEDIPIVHDFPDVFTDDVVGLPPIRQVEFRIDLVPGANPVAKAPYHLAPSKMQELSSQLQELSDKAFIRLGSSPWGAPVLFVKKNKDRSFRIHVDLAKTEAVKNWKTKTSSTEVCSFLGLAGYYRHFIRNFSKIVLPLTALKHKDKPYEWGSKQKEASQTLKDMFYNALILALPEGSEDFIVFCDASNQDFTLVLVWRLLKALYGRKCCSPICQNEVGESQISIGNFLSLTLVIVLYLTIECIGPAAYRLELPSILSNVHPVFHVSNLKKCLAEGNFQIPLDEVRIDETMHFVKRPVEIMDHKDKVTKRSRIPLVKVCWVSKQEAEFTWEREDQMKKFPDLFATAIL
ncbi:uncharacterized protein LOC143614000 [Bidens hawaiensis]|uniref:uncharacterized protein LOC143614000 n=1 Tax=Bidens hawaiensis TaxID=980011 RepID=UPI00404A6D9F